jgi:hypothetical protein
LRPPTHSGGRNACALPDLRVSILCRDESSSVVNTGDAGGEFTAEVETLS